MTIHRYALLPSAKCERSDRSNGYVIQRNGLRYDYIQFLSLDDSSFPAAGDLGGAVQFLDGKADGTKFQEGRAIQHPQRSIVRSAVISIPDSALRFLSAFPGILRSPQWDKEWPSLLWGWIEALWCSFRWRYLRRPLSIDRFRAWKTFPLHPQGGEASDSLIA